MSRFHGTDERVSVRGFGDGVGLLISWGVSRNDKFGASNSPPLRQAQSRLYRKEREQGREESLCANARQEARKERHKKEEWRQEGKKGTPLGGGSMV